MGAAAGVEWVWWDIGERYERGYVKSVWGYGVGCLVERREVG